ncbi:ATP-binding protein [Streptomyces sp. GZWMJZ-114]|uniref:ATP-binding protein n=1 Tax=Streptomyces sp. GZWMJZ-114 TaxID=2494734 RepID=UPI001010AB2B|nr:ATP-binding protein [Streptomyces sp. GZWMJZ-114]
MKNRASASPLFTPRNSDRATRRAARRALAEATTRARATTPSTPSAPTTRAQGTPLYPPRGRPGPASARSARLKLPSHRMTTAVAAGAYPFLAEGGLAAPGLYIGQDVHAESAFVFDPFELYGRLGNFTNANVLLAGVIGQGKSALAKSLAVRSAAFGYRIYVPSDPKGEWSAVADALGGTTVALGPGLPGRLNPLDPPPSRPRDVTETDWAAEVRKRRLFLLASLARTILRRDLRPMEHTALDVALDTAVATATTAGRAPLLGDVASVLHSPGALDHAAGSPEGQLAAAARDLAHALRRLVRGDLADLFDAPSTVQVDPTSPILTIDLSRLGDSGDDTALVLAMTCASAWMEAALADPDGPRRWIIYDEAWRLLRHPALLHRMQAQWKLSRGLGIANLLVIHRLSDLLAAGDAGSSGRAVAEGLLADCGTRVLYRQEADQLADTARLLGLTAVEAGAVAHLSRGRGLWKVADRSFVVQHHLHPTERALYDTDSRMR